MMKRIKKLIVVLFMICPLMIGVTGCSMGEKSAIKDTLEEFQYACQNKDLKAILRCIDPDIATPIRLGLALITTTSGKDYEKLIEDTIEALFTSSFAEAVDAEAFLTTLKITKPKYKIKKKAAYVRGVLEYEIVGEVFKQDVKITLIKKNDKWYISGFEFV